MTGLEHAIKGLQEALDAPRRQHMWRWLVRHRMSAVKDALGAQGSFLAVNNTVSQSVPHLHLHVVPRTKGDGLRGFFWPRTKYADGEAATYAARLRDALASQP